MIIKRWWCMDCRSAVNLDKHGRCESCASEAVDLFNPDTTQGSPVAMAETVVTSSLSCV